MDLGEILVSAVIGSLLALFLSVTIQKPLERRWEKFSVRMQDRLPRSFDQAITQLLRGLSGIATFVFGFFTLGQVLQVASWLRSLWIFGTILGAFGICAAYFHFVDRRHLNRFKDVVGTAGNGGWNVVLGSMTHAFFTLSLGLVPFYQESPMIFLPISLYFALIVDVWLMKRWFWKATQIGRRPNFSSWLRRIWV